MIDSLSGAMWRMVFLLGDLGLPAPPGITAPGGAPPPAGQLQVLDPAAPPAGVGGVFSVWWIVAYAGIFVGMYFILFRPQRKREKQRREMVAAIKAGDNVVTTGGLFGKVADVGDDSFLVEFGTNRGIRIPILKTDVLGVREPKMTPPPKETT